MVLVEVDVCLCVFLCVLYDLFPIYTHKVKTKTLKKEISSSDNNNNNNKSKSSLLFLRHVQCDNGGRLLDAAGNIQKQRAVEVDRSVRKDV